MELLLDLNLLDLVQAAGYLGIFAIVFAESGVFLGFFLPGDSLLFTAGILASQDYFNIWFLVPLIIIAAIAGDIFGYWFGRKMGESMYRWNDSWYFKKEYLNRTERFYARHGKCTVVIARFVPIVRTFAPVLAGAGKMTPGVFMFYNAIGGVLWGASMIFLGYFFGSFIPNPDAYVLPAVAVIILLSFLPALLSFRHAR